MIIPVFNGRETIGACLEAAFASRYENFEVIVVDDCSTDGSREIIKRFPARLIRLPERGGASKTRNAGARNARGEALFFTDADCVMLPDTLSLAAGAFGKHGDAVVGGTYTPLPHDRGFFSTFQSVFINYSETKREKPDYVATHAMLMGRERFLESGGFKEDFLPILEDVELSHRLRKAGVELLMEPEIRVRHIFNLNLARSLKNAFRKSMYWTMYSIENRDLLRDSGTASVELKADTVSWGVCVFLLMLSVLGWSAPALASLAGVCALNLAINRRFIMAMFKAGGPAFGAGAVLYYTALYPAAVGAGGLLGMVRRK